VQSSVSAEVNVERRSGTVIESVLVRMVAPKRQEKSSGAPHEQRLRK
jgi:hypothetical protein